MNLKKILPLILLFQFCLVSQAQDNSAGTGPAPKSFASERKLRKEERREAREKRRQEKAERKAVKAYHKRLQTKKVLKRMKQSKNKARLNNEHKREFFLKRWFKKKKKV
jgi:Ni/Co efflux regulator RcnB